MSTVSSIIEKTKKSTSTPSQHSSISTGKVASIIDRTKQKSTNIGFHQDGLNLKAPITIQAQDFNLNKIYGYNSATRTWEIKDPNYELIKNDNNKIIGIRQKPQRYRTYYEKDYSDGDKTERFSTYIPHEILFNEQGQVMKEVKRTSYQSDYDKKDGDELERKYKVYDRDIKIFDNTGNIVSRKEYDDYKDRDREYTDKRFWKREVYLKKEYDYSKNTVKVNPRPNSSIKDYTKADFSYEDARDYEVKQREIRQTNYRNKNTFIHTDKDGNIKNTSENLAELKGTNLSNIKDFNIDFDGDGDKENVSIGKLLSVAPQLKDDVIKYQQAVADNAKAEKQLNQYFSTQYSTPNAFSQVDIHTPTNETDPNRFAYNPITGAFVDRFTQQSVDPEIMQKQMDKASVDFALQPQVVKNAIAVGVAKKEYEDAIQRGDISRFYDTSETDYHYVEPLPDDAGKWAKFNHWLQDKFTSKVLPSKNWILNEGHNNYKELQELKKQGKLNKLSTDDMNDWQYLAHVFTPPAIRKSKFKAGDLDLSKYDYKMVEAVAQGKSYETYLEQEYGLNMALGGLKGLREKPATTGAFFSLTALGTPIISGVRYGALRYTPWLVNGRYVAPVWTGTGYAFKALPYAYGGVKAYEISQQPNTAMKFQKFGEIMTSEIAPMLAGGYIGGKLATPIEQRIALEKSIQRMGTRPIKKGKNKGMWTDGKKIFSEAEATKFADKSKIKEFRELYKNIQKVDKFRVPTRNYNYDELEAFRKSGNINRLTKAQQNYINKKDWFKGKYHHTDKNGVIWEAHHIKGGKTIEIIPRYQHKLIHAIEEGRIADVRKIKQIINTLNKGLKPNQTAGGKALKEWFAKNPDAIIGGSGVNRAQIHKSQLAKAKLPQDLDPYFANSKMKSSIKSISDALNKAGYKTKITSGGLELRVLKDGTYVHLMKAHDWERFQSMIGEAQGFKGAMPKSFGTVKAPDGSRLLDLKLQAQRQLIRATLQGQSQYDIQKAWKQYYDIMKNADYIANLERAGKFFGRGKVKKFFEEITPSKMFSDKSGILKGGKGFKIEKFDTPKLKVDISKIKTPKPSKTFSPKQTYYGTYHSLKNYYPITPIINNYKPIVTPKSNMPVTPYPQTKFPKYNVPKYPEFPKFTPPSMPYPNIGIYPPDIPVGTYPTSGTGGTYPIPPSYTEYIPIPPPDTPLPSKEKKSAVLGKPDNQGLNGYRPYTLDDSGNKIFSDKIYATYQEAVQEGMKAVDDSKFNKFQIQEEYVEDESELSKARPYKNFYKFRKVGGTWVEKKYYRFDKKNESNNGGFDIFPYVFNTQ